MDGGEKERHIIRIEVKSSNSTIRIFYDFFLTYRLVCRTVLQTYVNLILFYPKLDISHIAFKLFHVINESSWSCVPNHMACIAIKE